MRSLLYPLHRFAGRRSCGRPLPPAVALLACLSVLALPAYASAEAVPGQEITPGPVGLPDGRVYEQVTPGLNHGNFYDAPIWLNFGLASKDGNAVVYPMSGPVGEAAASGILTEFASRRTPAHGWQTVSTTSNPTSEATYANGSDFMLPSDDYKRFLFLSSVPYVAEDPGSFTSPSGVNIFLSESPFTEPQWLGKPRIANPEPSLGKVVFSSYAVAGASPSLSTVYFGYGGTLVPEDASRQSGWGFYEWHEGTLVSAGALPNGSFSPHGAVPAATGEAHTRTGVQANAIDNQVSEDGSEAFFVSPDPEKATVAEPAELYVRMTGSEGLKTSVLVSASKLPGHDGEAAPSGVALIPNAYAEVGFGASGYTYAYASADGSHVFFASRDPLTTDAPSNAEVKLYDYDTNTGDLSYLPNVTAPIVQVSHDGSEMLFESKATTPPRLDLWQSGVGVTTIAELTSHGPRDQAEVDESHFNEDGSNLIFRTSSKLPGGFNSGNYAQVYRYDVPTAELSCISCPPKGVTPTSGAHMSYNSIAQGFEVSQESEPRANGLNATPATTLETRAMSPDGKRVFFDTTSALVPQDTDGVRDVYEWENGTVYLISSGHGSNQSLYLDNDSTGENVFFATQDGLVPGDPNESYDVYDARIPRPGDNPPPAAVPCKGAVCQGPPSVPQLLGLPASQTFNGAGNVSPAAGSSDVGSKSLTRAQKLARALKACKRRAGAQARKRCRSRARRQYGTSAAVGRSPRGNETRHHNGRGK